MTFFQLALLFCTALLRALSWRRTFVHIVMILMLFLVI
jgi:hypothetical protein